MDLDGLRDATEVLLLFLHCQDGKARHSQWHEWWFCATEPYVVVTFDPAQANPEFIVRFEEQ